MPEIASIYQLCQLGLEVTPGTAVAANKRLSALMIRPQPKTDIKKWRGSGYKFPTIASMNKEWTEAALSGPLTYTELPYLLHSLIGVAAATGAGTAKTRTYVPDSDGADTVQSYTVEWGDATRALEFAYGIVNELTLAFSREGCELSGSMLGRAIVDNVTLTGSPTTVGLVPIFPTQVSVMLADTGAGLDSASDLTRVVSAEWSMGDRFNPAYFLNNSVDWTAHVEKEPTLTAKLKMEKDAAGMALLTTMRAGATKFMRIEAEGGVISGADTYLLQADIAGKIIGDPTFSNEDGVECVEWSFEGFHDATWGKSTQVKVVNDLATL